MTLPASLPHLNDAGSLSPGEVDAVLACARALRNAAASGDLWQPLRGRNIGLLCESHDHPDAALFERAAAGLGAKVTRILLSASGLLAANDMVRTARVLGRLYNAIECQGVAPELVARIREFAGVPVFDGMALAGRPCEALAALLAEGRPQADNRLYVIQALLIGSTS